MDRQENLPSPFDALMPQETAIKAEAIGKMKTERPIDVLLVLSILAGAFIALGAAFSNLVGIGLADALPFGLARLLVGLVFSLGLVLVVVCGAELFTGDVLMVIAWASGQVRTNQLLRVWAIVFIGNFMGALGTALLIFLSGHLDMKEGALATAILNSALMKVAMPLWNAFWLGVLCNVLVCLAVWGSLSARSVTDKILIVVFPVSAFVALGFEHSIANMYVISLALLIKAFSDPSLSMGLDSVRLAALDLKHFSVSLFVVTAGNIAGGSVLVAFIYWLAFLRRRKKE